MKTKPQFTIGTSVRTAVNSGQIKQVAEYADHFEYLVEWPDGTAAWIHERNLTVTPTPAAAAQPQ